MSDGQQTHFEKCFSLICHPKAKTQYCTISLVIIARLPMQGCLRSVFNTISRALLLLLLFSSLPHTHTHTQQIGGSHISNATGVVFFFFFFLRSLKKSSPHIIPCIWSCLKAFHQADWSTGPDLRTQSNFPFKNSVFLLKTTLFQKSGPRVWHSLALSGTLLFLFPHLIPNQARKAISNQRRRLKINFLPTHTRIVIRRHLNLKLER